MNSSSMTYRSSVQKAVQKSVCILMLSLFVLGGCASKAKKEEAAPLRDQIEGTIKNHRDDFFMCRQPGYQPVGRLKIAFVVQKNGKASETKVKDSTLKKSKYKKNFEDCLVGVMNAAQFPEQTAPVPVIYPFTFNKTE